MVGYRERTLLKVERDILSMCRLDMMGVILGLFVDVSVDGRGDADDWSTRHDACKLLDYISHLIGQAM